MTEQEQALNETREVLVDYLLSVLWGEPTFILPTPVELPYFRASTQRIDHAGDWSLIDNPEEKLLVEIGPFSQVFLTRLSTDDLLVLAGAVYRQLKP